MSLWSKIIGTINTAFQLGLGGPQLSANSGNVELRNAAGTGFVIGRGASPVGDNDFTTKSYVDQISKPIPATLQFSGGSALPSNSGTEQWYVVTTTGVNATIGQLLWDDGSGTGTVTVMPAVGGRVIGIQSALTGGTISFLADSLYMWDSGSTTWFNVSGSAISGAKRLIRMPITNAASQSSTTQMPANSVVTSAMLDVAVAYSAGATISVGYTGTASAFMATTDSLVTTAGQYQVMQDVSIGASAQNVLITVAGAPSAGSGFCLIEYSVPNV